MATSHRWRSILGVVVVASVALIGIVALRTRPFTSGSSSWGPGRPAGPGRTEAIWGARPFSIGFELSNDGSLPMRVTEISIPASTDHDLLTWGAPLIDPEDRGSNQPSRLSPFAPFTLRNGEAVWVVLRGRFGNCSAFPAPPTGGSTSQSWSRVDVGFRWVGVVPRHQSVALPTVVEVERPTECRTP
jgi:hypothetical protein